MAHPRTPSSTVRRSAWAALAALVLALLAPSGALAQTERPQRLTDDTVARTSPTGDDVRAIEANVAWALEGMQSDDWDRARAARDWLLEPLRRGEVSVGFRLSYSRALARPLRGMMERPAQADPHATFRRVNAARLAGMIATGEMEQLLGRALEDDNASEAVRFAAAYGYEELLRALAQGAGSIPQAQLDRVLRDLRGALADEPSPRVAEQLIMALDATSAGVRRGEPIPELRRKAMARMAEGYRDRLLALRAEGDRALAGDWAEAALRFLPTARDALVRQLPLQTADDRAFAVALGEASGVVLAEARDHLAGEPETEARESLGLLVAGAEQLLLLAHQNLTREEVEGELIADAFRTQDPARRRAEFGRAVDRWIGRSGRLTERPYALDAGALAPRAG